jgi:undecaprenyl-diphosphatase
MMRLVHRLPWLRRFDSRMLLLLLVLAPALALFVKVASEVSEGDTLAIDRWILRAMRSEGDAAVPIGPSWLREAMIDFTALGGGAVLTLVTLMAAGYLLARRKIALAMFLSAAIGAGALLNTALKYGFVRERPDVVPHLVQVTSASFPSGHAMNSAMVYLTLAALLVSAERSWRVRIFLVSAAMLLTLVVGFSRAFLGVHWPTDILAGWSIGAAWAVLASLIAARLQRQKAIEGAEVEDEPHGSDEALDPPR